MNCALAIGWLALLVVGGRDAEVAGETSGKASSSNPTATDSATAFSKSIAPFVAKYCGDCHSGSTPEAKLDLTKYADAAAVDHGRKVWRKVFFKLEAGEMPPQDQTQPKADEVAAVVHWIDAELSRPVPLEEQDPGRMTIRRLNRAEYNNTIRDLLGIDFHPADSFPTDDVGEGFDDIGALLSVSPILVEKYLAAAEQCVDRALTILPESPPESQSFRASRLDFDGKVEQVHRGAAWLSSGEVFLRWHPKKEGEYRLRVRAFGEPAGNEPVRMSLRLDGNQIERFDVKPGNADSAAVYAHPVKVDSESHKISIALVGPPRDAKSADSAKKSDRLAVLNLEIEGPLPTGPALPEPYRRIVICQPASESKDAKPGSKQDAKTAAADRADCARRVLRNFADRAFRRPVKDEELDRLTAIWQRADAKNSGLFDRSLAVPLEAVLVSPQFLFRVESDPAANPTKPHRINDFELASRLSYFLWSSMPDDDLFALAHRDELHKPDVLEAQVRRMIADPKSQALIDNFAAQWLQFRRLKNVAPDKTVFPQFDESLRIDMRSETELYFAHIMRDDRSVLELLDSDYTYLNHRLAQVYGISNVEGPEFRRVSVAGKHRGGVLTQSSVLAVTSNPGRTSPVQRGKWILETLLGAAPPPPPPNVPPLPDDKGKAALHGTLRQRMEQHRSNAICASCHKTMDALGFGLENFDALGRWRTKDGADPIDASGTLPGGRSFNGVDGLKKVLLAQRDQFCHCFVEKMLTYALGRAMEDCDATAVDQIDHDAAANNYRFSSIVVGIVRSAPFEMRRGKEQSVGARTRE